MTSERRLQQNREAKKRWWAKLTADPIRLAAYYAKTNRKRRARYLNDPDYREHLLQENAEWSREHRQR